MITQLIVKHEDQSVSKNFSKKLKFVIGSQDHRLYIFNKLLKDIEQSRTIKVGAYVMVKGFPRKQKGQILSIEQDISQVQWTGLKALPIEIYLPGSAPPEDIIVCHISDIV